MPFYNAYESLCKNENVLIESNLCLPYSSGSFSKSDSSESLLKSDLSTGESLLFFSWIFKIPVKIGNPKANVLPLPVSAAPKISLLPKTPRITYVTIKFTTSLTIILALFVFYIEN